MFAPAEALLEATGACFDPPDQADHEYAVAAIRAQPGGKEFAKAWADGQAISMEQAVAYALNWATSE